MAKVKLRMERLMRNSEKQIWKKRGIFFGLPYWDIITGFSPTPTVPRTNSHELERDTLAYEFSNSSKFSEPNFPILANSANPSSTAVLHILMIHRPNFGENGRKFEVVKNRQTFSREQRVEEREK